MKVMLLPTDYAWLAGLIDGDGSFTIRNKGQGGPTLEIAMTHKETIDYLLETFGECVSTPTVHNPRARQYWKWYTNTDWLRIHLPHLIPYMVTKKPRAVLVLEVVSIRRGRGFWLSPDERERLDQIHLELTILNKRGVE